MDIISAFDVIGPIMIGPSSSHTAGALRIALLARGMVRDTIVGARFTLYGSFAETYRGHGTDRALVAGILGFGTEDRKIKDSFTYAQQAGLVYSFVCDTTRRDLHPNTVEIELTDAHGHATMVQGVSLGGGRAEIRAINGIEVRLTGEYSTVLIHQTDAPGVLAYITRVLSEQNINIAFLKLYREKRGETAYTIVEADQEIPQAVVHEMEQHPSIHSAILVA